MAGRKEGKSLAAEARELDVRGLSRVQSVVVCPIFLFRVFFLIFFYIS